MRGRLVLWRQDASQSAFKEGPNACDTASRADSSAADAVNAVVFPRQMRAASTRPSCTYKTASVPPRAMHGKALSVHSHQLIREAFGVRAG